MTGKRPGGVTLVAVIAWISGALQILLGVLQLIVLMPFNAIVSIVIGVITILVSTGLFGGRNGARLLMTILFVINILNAAYLALTHPAEAWTAVFNCIVPLIGLVLLYSPKANAFFSR
jgi:hypothetical protein